MTPTFTGDEVGCIILNPYINYHYPLWGATFSFWEELF
ncbi:Hypothetical protein P9215_02981 [Prochlorococcus marinus str. MIT 9215]|uniref:Uncharacterized protein n=1 Tax=Prochlorococcus marinus (strain MIT 9215) TaxID=93060 RepID=A8G2T4_PROM2|nr:Hypothetical protein P9215_02981 [Prochlorococcus marinus str. MIT 9215]